jgi:hypothetical protein
VPIFPLSGAYARVGDEDTAFVGNRSGRYVLNISAIAVAHA